MPIERATARKCRVIDLHGRYVQNDGINPSYVETPFGKVNRANIVAAVVARQGKKSVVVDDGTGQIEVRAFDDERLFEKVSPGEIVLLIGRPRRFQEQAYLVAEICKTLSGPKWLELRKAELARISPDTLFNITGPQPKPTTHISKSEKPPTNSQTTKSEKKKGEEKKDIVAITADKILDIIRKLDDGQGAPVERVLAEAGSGDAETMLTNLLAEGEIFEIRAGRVKVLE